jgi:hypothetical protein
MAETFMYMCECGEPKCRFRLSLMPSEYKRLAQKGRIISPNHQLDEVKGKIVYSKKNVRVYTGVPV